MLAPTEQIVYGGIRILDRPCMANVDRLDHGALPMIEEYHTHGVLIDQSKLSDLSVRLQVRAMEIDDEIEMLVGKRVNPNSGDQVAELLFRDLGLKPPPGLHVKMTSSRSRESVDDEVLSAFKNSHPVVPLITEGRQVKKLDGTYAGKLGGMVHPETGRLHTDFKHTRADTGRLTSSNPNLQNIPVRTALGKEIRDAFVAGKDSLGRQCVLVSIDLSQIEMVLTAHMSGDEKLLEVFNQGLDAHVMTVLNCLNIQGEERQFWLRLASRAKREEDTGVKEEWAAGEKEAWKEFKNTKRLPFKVVGFGILYGQTPLGLQSNIMSQGGPFLPLLEVEQISGQWFSNYSGVARWMDMQHGRVVRFGCVWDMWGRMRMIPEGMSRVPRIKRAGLRQAGNMPVQGGAQGMIKLDMFQLMDYVRLYQSYSDVRCWPLLQIHDELIFELSPNIVDDFCADALNVMKHNVKLRIPVGASCSTAYSWGDLK